LGFALFASALANSSPAVDNAKLRRPVHRGVKAFSVTAQVVLSTLTGLQRGDVDLRVLRESLDDVPALFFCG